MQSIQEYNTTEQARPHHAKQGFDLVRKNLMLDVTVETLTLIAPAQTTLLDPGAGTRLLSSKILAVNYFREFYIADGAPVMLQIA